MSLTRRTPLRRYTPLRAVSAKRKRREAKWKPISKQLRSERKVCEAPAAYLPLLSTAHLSDAEADRISDALRCCTGSAQEAHHVIQRSLGGTDDPSNIKVLCSACHRWIDDNIALAHKLGLLRHSWEAV